jgi:hypothetical protein
MGFESVLPEKKESLLTNMFVDNKTSFLSMLILNLFAFK